MKKTTVLCFVLAVIAVGCFGKLARDNVLLPAMELAWPGVQNSIAAGITDASDAGDINQEQVDLLLSEASRMSDVLAAGDREALAGVDWPTLNNYATRGVAARVLLGEIGPNGAKLFLRRIAEFNKAYFKALER